MSARSAFTADSNGMFSSRLSLASLAGSSVRFRFRIGTDTSVGYLGWFIDDLRIYTCPATVSHVYIPAALKGITQVATPFHSPFNGSAPLWLTHSGDWVTGPQHLYSEGLDNTGTSTGYSHTYENFVYTVRMKRTGCADCANRILVRGVPQPLVGTNDWNSSYTFQYVNRMNDGSSIGPGYSVYKRLAGGAPILLVNWTRSNAIHAEGWNVLKVVMDGSSMEFYINGVLLASGPDSSLTSGKVGIGMYGVPGFDLLQVDWAQVTDLPIQMAAAGAAPQVTSPLPGGNVDRAP